MLDKFLNFASLFDLITPLATFAQDLQNHPSVGYNISVDAGWSAYAIRDLLQGAGIKLWGLTIFNGLITFRVRRAQARYTQYWLERNGIPYVGGVKSTQQSFTSHPQSNLTQRTAKNDQLRVFIDQTNNLLDKL